MRISRERMADLQQSGSESGLSCLIPSRDYSYMNRNTEELRVWLPEPARRGLDEVCERLGVSMTVYLVEYFTSYLFGYHELLRMQDTRSGLYEPKPVTKNCAMGVAQPPESNLGKNIFALKIFVPEMVKTRLIELATRVDHKLGEYTRALICAHLFGREYAPRVLISGIEEMTDEAAAWEDGCIN